MKNILLYLQKNYRTVYLLFIFLVCSLAILYVYPGQVQFKYDFQRGKPWQHEDLLAPFSFTKQKSAEQLNEEKQKLTENKDLFFKQLDNVNQAQLDLLATNWALIGISDSIKRMDSARVWSTFSFIYSKGIIERIVELDVANQHSLYLTKGNKVVQFQLEDFYTEISATELLKESLRNERFAEALEPYLVPNVVFDNERTEEFLAERIARIITNRGFVQQGDLIILKGSVVDDEKFLVLNSLKNAYEGNLMEESFPYQLVAGQFIYIIMLLGTLYYFIHFFRTSLLNYISNVNLILFSVFWMVFVAIL